jgi:uncharacterized phage-associated protein
MKRREHLANMSNSVTKLTPNRPRIAEAILLLIARAEHKRVILTQYDIVKTLFLADTGHIETYGRPITFDNYVAMTNGPVPSEAYDMLKPNYRHAEQFDSWPLWESRPYKGKTNMYLEPKRPPNLSKISVSERQELEKAQDIVWSLGFLKTRDMTHKHPAYVAAWNESGGQKSYAMDYLLLVGKDEDLFESVVFASRNA